MLLQTSIGEWYIAAKPPSSGSAPPPRNARSRTLQPILPLTIGKLAALGFPGGPAIGTTPGNHRGGQAVSDGIRSVEMHRLEAGTCLALIIEERQDFALDLPAGDLAERIEKFSLELHHFAGAGHPGSGYPVKT